MLGYKESCKWVYCAPMPTRVYSLGQSPTLQKAPTYAPKNALEVLKAIYFLMFRFRIKVFENQSADA
ncbi:hypothetical protein [Helicobacter sp. MIT 01-3238]|uniref:hypothetical protein n=1 Tax=Helicobacter sp. MIT 01-3238 TaxID=398627 RepID=UPI000E1E7F56|nr:hypothetical protein [Helicobacter sp. MIT 01-3238]RDU54519.1 hypothetical protein CQA40_03085 [Helicobacter sp. MIT 01-3238]